VQGRKYTWAQQLSFVLLHNSEGGAVYQRGDEAKAEEFKGTAKVCCFMSKTGASIHVVDRGTGPILCRAQR
jgi:hypothetical protein